MASLADEGEDDGPDPRVEGLKTFISSNSDAEAVVAHLKSIGSQPVVIAETLVSDDNVIQCFLLGEAVLENATGDDGKLASKLSVQLKEGKAAYFKALAAGNAEKEATALCCLERWLVVHDDLADLHYTFNQVYAAEIVTDDAVYERWFETPNLSRYFALDDEAREASRAAAEPYMDWLRNASGGSESD